MVQRLAEERYIGLLEEVLHVAMYKEDIVTLLEGATGEVQQEALSQSHSV